MGVRNLRRRARINKLREQFREDRLILGICLVIALGMWVFTKMAQSYRTKKVVVFEYQLPPDRTFITAPPDKMEMEIQGSGWDLLYDFISSRQIRMTYDLRNTGALHISRGQFRSRLLAHFRSKDIGILELPYDELHIELEPKSTKKVPVMLKSRIAFAPEFQLKAPIRISPDSLTITGPISKVLLIEEWKTDSLIVSDLKRSMVIDLSLKPSPREFYLDPPTVSVEVPVEQYTEKSVFVPVRLQNVRDSVSLFPNQVKITFKVGLSRFDQVQSSDFAVEADLAKAISVPDHNTIPFHLVRQPGYVRDVQMVPQAAEFFIIR